SCALERERLGFTHADTGGYLLGIWGLPDAIAEAVAGHHAPHTSGEGPREPLTVVHVAQALAHAKLTPETGLEDLEGCGLDRDYLSSVGVLEAAEEWVATCAESVCDG
ncbi:MAG: HDOD domain-containing protein, partial [Myxococcota bacterium]